MACATCQSGSSPGGCQNNGHCATGGCNKMNTYDWLSQYDFEDPTGTDIVEISFKKGARKEFYRNHQQHPAQTKDMVVVDTGTGFDVGVVSLSGELVRLQMKKKRTKEISITNPVVRIANDRDIERLNEYRNLEKQAMVKGRAISYTLGLDMKICDVEYRGDGRKATFYYTAEGRIDFRELVRLYAKEFQVKVEMRQIGARQESSRIGGIGTCGRELCCSTWLTDFKSVNTHAARYQNLSINQAKLSGQCGRLKCCLNYELDTYMEAIDEFPQDVDILRHKAGSASLIKMDIFKRLLYYSVEVERGRNTVMSLSLDRVKEVKAMNLKGELPDQLQDPNLEVEEEKLDFADVGGDIELPDYKKKKNKNKKNLVNAVTGKEVMVKKVEINKQDRISQGVMINNEEMIKHRGHHEIRMRREANISSDHRVIRMHREVSKSHVIRMHQEANKDNGHLVIQMLREENTNNDHPAIRMHRKENKDLVNLVIRMHQEESRNRENRVSLEIQMHLAKKAAINKVVDRIATETEIVTVTEVPVRKAERNHHKTIHRHDL